MKILFICHRFPYPPKRGGKIRPFNVIKHLSASHEVCVASLVRSAAEVAEGAGIATHCAEFHMVRVNELVQRARTIARVPTTLPSSMGFFYSAQLAGLIRRLLRERSFDLVFVHCSSVAQYVAHVKQIPKILDFGDMDSQKWFQYARYKPFPVRFPYWLEGRKLQAEERRLHARFDLCTATTRAEWEVLNSHGLSAPTDWFPNGVDAEFFMPGPLPYDPDSICFVGRMDYYPNQQCMIEFCSQTLPLLRQQRPGLKLIIVGADPSAAVRRLAALPGVIVTGSVPDVRPYVQGCALMVAPLNIAHGTQNKILEAMAMGVPVVTSRVAAAGVDAIPGAHFHVASSPEAYTAAILRIAGDPAERRRLAVCGRARVLSHHAWSGSMKRLDSIIDRCLESFAFKTFNGQLAS